MSRQPGWDGPPERLGHLAGQEDSGGSVVPEQPDCATIPADNWPTERGAGTHCCRTCRSFVVKGSERPDAPGGPGQLGRCRRHAPELAGFPAVYETDWCGDHKLR